MAAAAADVATVILVAILVSCLYTGVIYGSLRPSWDDVFFGAVVAFLFGLLTAYREEYRLSSYLVLAGHVRRVVLIWHLSCFLALVFAFAFKRSDAISRGAAAFFYLGGLAALIALRAAVVRHTRARAASGQRSTLRVVLVGNENELRAFASTYKPWTLGMNVVASAVLRGRDTLNDDLALASASARVLQPDDIFILVDWREREIMDACIAAFMCVPAGIHLGLQPVLDRFGRACVSRIGHIASLNIVKRPLNVVDVVLKRSFDLGCAALLLVALSPLMGLLALAIKLDSPGNALFIQRRYGFNQQSFRIVKFRTMTVAEDGRAVRAAELDDQRITRIGAFMRRYNLDELPQLINVLGGTMSLVGPRPHALVHNQQYERTIDDYARRHNMKPGITGWAQIHGLRGEISSTENMRARLDHDLFYMDNWSFGLDLRILLMTIVSARAYENAR